jgi:hypothetical protein
LCAVCAGIQIFAVLVSFNSIRVAQSEHAKKNSQALNQHHTQWYCHKGDVGCEELKEASRRGKKV